MLLDLLVRLWPQCGQSQQPIRTRCRRTTLLFIMLSPIACYCVSLDRALTMCLRRHSSAFLVENQRRYISLPLLLSVDDSTMLNLVIVKFGRKQGTQCCRCISSEPNLRLFIALQARCRGFNVATMVLRGWRDIVSVRVYYISGKCVEVPLHSPASQSG